MELDGNKTPDQAKVKKSILVVEDNPDFTALLRARLEHEHYIVYSTNKGADADRLLERSVPNLVLLDFKLPDMDGLTLLATIREEYSEIPVIMMTAFGSENLAVQAMKAGAYDYIKKPIDMEELLLVAARAIAQHRLHVENRRLKGQISRDNRFRNILGASNVMQSIFNQIAHILDSDTNLFISGETGTGKDLIAKAIHFEGVRKNGPWISLNCAAITENLFESELFGHVKGAFTGAIRNNKGKIPAADGGTLFLDEITELSFTAQAKLLQVIQDGTFTPVGSHEVRQADVRFIAATNSDIQKSLDINQFRNDLFYRLAVFTINVPPLRERASDILLLADSFLQRMSERYSKPTRGFDPEVQEALIRYRWPGNVRELENLVERAVIMSSGPLIGLKDLTFAARPDPPHHTAFLDMNDEPSSQHAIVTFKRAKRIFEKNYLVYLLNRSKGNISLASRLSGVNRSDLYRILKKYDLELPDFRAGAP
ncbi:sigma-54-dependent Fis family transcriptional regulator [bacterium]|nr:sigma-54-dependent Fis family transcriptional regulator [candidate division CSSED10-310 bacterium]